jgi:hypothetical protein
MTHAGFEQLLTLALVHPVHTEERPLLRDGYTTLLKLGWPTTYINPKMCERAFAGLVPRYEGMQSWTAYKRDWAADDIKR